MRNRVHFNKKIFAKKICVMNFILHTLKKKELLNMEIINITKMENRKTNLKNDKISHFHIHR